MIYVPAQAPEDWKRFLAEPEKHWKPGYSAYALAHAWQDAPGGFPERVREVLIRPAGPFPGIEPLLALPEHKVSLPPRGARPSQNDLWVLARAGDELVSIAVEGKVNESFGPTVEEWGPETSEGKKERFAFLKNKLGLMAVPATVRYQFLHRAVSAVLEAVRFKAGHAVMLVHSFSAENRGFEDYENFLSLFGVPGRLDAVATTPLPGGMPLHLGWVRDKLRP